MNLSIGEMLFIFFLALIVFGPKKMPEIGRQIGKALAEFKRASNEFKSQLENEMRQIEIEEALKKEQAALTPAPLPPEGTVAAGSVEAETNWSGEYASSPAPESPVDPVATDSEPSHPAVAEETPMPSILPPGAVAGNGEAGELPSSAASTAANAANGENHRSEANAQSPGVRSAPAANVGVNSEIVQGGNA
jgi:sec-independent protein translocase protein TatB